MKKYLVLILMLILFLPLGAQSKKQKTKEGKRLNIYYFNESAAKMIENNFLQSLPDDVEYEFYEYQNANVSSMKNLYRKLKENDAAKPEEKIDIVLVESQYVQDFMPYMLDVKNDIGLTDSDLSQQYKSITDVMKDADGKLRGVAWQACPGGFFYRRSIAKKVFGTDEPAEIQKQLNNWQKFEESASKLKNVGYYMLAGYEDSFPAFDYNRKLPLVYEKNVIIDSMLYSWIGQTKDFKEKGYSQGVPMWSSDWENSMKKDGKVFGYFGPAWMLYTLSGVSNSAAGDWAFCKGPQSYVNGGTWICAAKGTDDPSLVHDLMYALTCDKEVMKKIAIGDSDFVNNKLVMNEIADSDYKIDFLGGQDLFKVLVDIQNSLETVPVYRTVYDGAYKEYFLQNMSNYFNGTYNLTQAFEKFYSNMKSKYRELKK